MKNADESFITIGKIGATYGVKGWLKIQTFTEFGANILNYSPWYIPEGEDEWRVITLEDSKVNCNTVIVKFADVDNPEKARLYTGKIIAVLRSQLPTLPKNEYYWSDLEGLTVINKQGVVFGTVSYLMETGSNDVLVVKGQKEHAIPYLPGTVVIHVDLTKREILVDWEEI